MIALVTGGATGIGAATVRRLAARGDRVAILDLDAERGESLARECDAIFLGTDVASLPANEQAVAEVVERYGRLDAAILNAGIAGRCGLDDFSEAGYRATLGTNLDGVVYGLRACLPHLRRTAGSVVVTASIAGLTGSPDLFYAASKAAVIGLVRSAATPLAADGVTINAVCPGLVDTDIVAAYRDQLAAHGLALATPDEVAAGILAVLGSGRSGLAWVVQAGRPPAPVEHVDVPLVRASGHAGPSLV